MVEWRVFRRLFTEAVRGPEEDVDLTLACLYIAGEEYPEIDVDRYAGEIDGIAARVADNLPGDATIRSWLGEMGHYLSHVEGFHGDPEGRSDPRTGYLNEVIDRKVGIPISLSVLYKEVAARNGVLLEGVGLPGRFILRCRSGEGDVFIDPWDNGSLLTRADCEELVRRRYQGSVPFREEYLYPFDKKQVLVRLLTSLKVAYFESREHARSLAAADRIAIVDPSLDVNIRERGRLHYLLGHYREAIRSLELYLRLFPEASDKEDIENQIRGLWTLIANLS